MNPFVIEGPAIISFSGGRTSAYMLRRILDAHGGTLPADVVVCFANTGKEREETLAFVHECATRWKVPVVWLEYAIVEEKIGYRRVDFFSASRNGEPFDALIHRRQFLPNPVMRFCTGELKIRTTKRFAVKELRWSHWTSALGLRADEPRRVARATTKRRERWDNVCPLASAGIDKPMINAYWAASDFDLGLRDGEGNCDLCFLKGAPKIARIMDEHPELSSWWIEKESIVLSRGTGKGGVFRKDRPRYAKLQREARSICSLPLLDEIQDCACSE